MVSSDVIGVIRSAPPTSTWRGMNNDQRVQLMLETAIDLTMQGFSLPAVLRAFAEVSQFRALGDQSVPMCRALTKALIGESLERFSLSGEEVSFEELLVAAPSSEFAPRHRNKHSFTPSVHWGR
jgi:hypothetical protein